MLLNSGLLTSKYTNLSWLAFKIKSWQKKDTDERALLDDRYWSLKKDHFSASVLSFLPEQLHEFDTGAQQQQDTFSQQDSQQQASNNMRT